MTDEQSFSWGDEARVAVWPLSHPSPSFRGDLASCVRRAIEVSQSEPLPAHVEIVHASGIIDLNEARRMAADPSFPPRADVAIEDLELGPMS